MSNMIQLLGSIPNNVTLACSGGPDSMAILAFLLRGRKNVKLVYFNHGTKHADSAQAFVEQVAHERNLSLEIGNIKRDRLPSESVEEYWRNQRYNFFNQFSGPLITGHHLDDVAEWWIFSSLNGTSRLIPYRREPNVIRPFLKATKSQLVRCALSQGFSFLQDPSNSNVRYRRNLIRKKIMPHAFEVNPGLYKMLRKKIDAEFQRQSRADLPVC